MGAFVGVYYTCLCTRDSAAYNRLKFGIFKWWLGLKNNFEVVDGNSASLERRALYAIFQSPSEFQSLLNQLKPAANANLLLVSGLPDKSNAQSGHSKE